MQKIPYGRQSITDEDIEAVSNVLRSDFLTQGPVIGEFENKFSQYVGSKNSVAVVNGTAALHLGVLALGLKEGQKVITTPITFAASANCVKYLDGEVDLVDIDPRTYLIDLNQIEDRLKSGDYAGIIPVDFAGLALNMEELRTLADRYGCWILEDACHAPGGFFVNSDGDKVRCGSGRYEDAAIFSFHPVKHIATGEGGMITTSDTTRANRLQKLRTHGIHKDPSRFTNSPRLAAGSAEYSESDYPKWYYEMDELGYNYRMTDIQCALGSSQLERAEIGLAKRREIANFYDRAFENHPHIETQTLTENEKSGHAYHLYVIRTENRLRLYNHLHEHGILGQIHYVPIHYLPFHSRKSFNLPQAEAYYSQCLSLPMFPTLTSEELDYIVGVIDKYQS